MISGKIYKIVSSNSDKVYIGSTTYKYLSKRHGIHLCNYRKFLLGKHNYLSSFDVIQYGDTKIELLEEITVPVSEKQEIFKREGFWINEFKDTIINHNKAGRTKKERYAENREYYIEKQKKYNLENKERIKTYYKNYVAYKKRKSEKFLNSL
jgi:hypothetical protein